jgi:hypothetical protein
MTQFGKLKIHKTYEKTRTRSDSACGIRKVLWHSVQCICGSEPFEITHKSLVGGSQSCHSCSHSGSKNSKGSHGESDCKARGERRNSTAEYRTWKSIKRRCSNCSVREYANYGGRGIKVCDRWLNSYENFLADMGRKPSPKHSINRIDNNTDYSPENCEWADDTKQRRNKRTSVMLELNGEQKNISDWLMTLGVPEGTYYWRRRHGYSIHEALGIQA